jgi:hypothetical protein
MSPAEPDSDPTVAPRRLQTYNSAVHALGIPEHAEGVSPGRNDVPKILARLSITSVELP